jgi:large subunit ribosomal protein L40e
MRIYIKALQGKTTPLDVNPFDSVDTVKQQIHVSQGIPPEQQRLLYAGQQLNGGRMMADYIIQDQTTVHLNARAASEPPSKDEISATVKSRLRSDTACIFTCADRLHFL